MPEVSDIARAAGADHSAVGRILAAWTKKGLLALTDRDGKPNGHTHIKFFNRVYWRRNTERIPGRPTESLKKTMTKDQIIQAAKRLDVSTNWTARHFGREALKLLADKNEPWAYR